jgi:hypothetical protein
MNEQPRASGVVRFGVVGHSGRYSVVLCMA